MAKSNRDRVGAAMDLLKVGLYPFVERELKAKFGDQWEAKGRENLLAPSALIAASPQAWDVSVLLSMLDTQWQYVFRFKLGKSDRNLVFELRDIRNKWAHQEPFGIDDTNRALDSAKRLLISVGAAVESEEVDKQLQEVLRQKYEEMSRKETKKAAASSVEGKFSTGLPGWREVITPHQDVASGNYLMAEFAADLWQVYKGEGGSEYKDPTEFFRRTFLTEGLADLLVLGLKRLSGQIADPVVKLQTNFGGGKTHSMLALYHLCGGAGADRLVGVDALMKKAGVKALPKVRRVVIVGNKLSPAMVVKKPDGSKVHTLWGELAWQLGGAEGYAMVKESDEKGVSPGDLTELLRKFSPCIVLIDEWVSFVRQLYGINGLPAGSFDANLTFAQTLTESFKSVPNAMLVASLPSSDIEIGGDGGKDALKRLENTFDRVQSTWRPATADECFEIVRRRLFQSIDADKFAARDAVSRAFADMYRQAGAEFPMECKEADYERRIQNSYPIHPELFDRLFLDWATLDRFQKTRGVLRLMASVIHSLWERQDGNLLIMPATIPMDEPGVVNELTRYMEDQWTPVIEKDVDGGHSLPLRIDRENPAFGRVSAARRVARTLYFGSAPTANSQNRGIDDRRIKLGCVQPGEVSATFGDALRRLSDQATHIYVDQSRYWLATQPSVTRLAQDRAAQLERKTDDVHAEIVRRVREEQNSRGEFSRVHACPASSGDVPDEQEVRLVILAPEQTHSSKATDSPALIEAKSTLEQRGTTPRLCRNALVFLAADKSRLAELQQAVRQYLAWHSIEDEAETLNLDSFGKKQAKTKREQADDTIKQRIPETYQWLLVPGQPTPQSPIEWSEVRLQGADRLAPRASKKLATEGNLAVRYAGTLLRAELDKVPLWRGENVSVKQLVEDFSQYLYLQRLKGPQVLLDAVKEGVGLLTWQSEGFAYADFYDDKKKRYAGLRTVQIDNVVADGRSLVVRPDAANRQMDAEAPGPSGPATGRVSGTGVGEGGGGGTGNGPTDPAKPPTPSAPTRFYGVVEVDATRFGRDAGRIAQDVLVHLTALKDANVTVTIEIHAEVPDGVEQPIVRAVIENCRVLKFKSLGFEER